MSNSLIPNMRNISSMHDELSRYDKTMMTSKTIDKKGGE